MKSIKDMESVLKPRQRFIKEYICDGCDRAVEQKEMIIPVGPRKGEKIIADIGCKCEDIRLVEQALKQREQAKLRKAQGLFEGSSIMNRSLQTATFKNYQPPNNHLQEVKSKLMKYANEFDKDKSSNLLFSGGYGVGKSHLAISITKEVMNKGYTGLFLSVPKLLTKIKETYSGNNKFSEADILNLVESVDLFVLDDLGTEYTNQRNKTDNWTHTKLFEVLDSRSGKPTIFTTNLESDQLENKLNERNFSRILDGTEIIKMDGPDFRRRKF